MNAINRPRQHNSYNCAWTADGVDYSEQEATEELIRIAREYPS